jgi:hypothetical protein
MLALECTRAYAVLSLVAPGGEPLAETAAER